MPKMPASDLNKKFYSVLKSEIYMHISLFQSYFYAVDIKLNKMYIHKTH